MADVFKVVALGNTGVGKSSLLNMLAGEDVFAVGESAMSETQMVTARDRHFMGSGDKVLVRLIDTQGLSNAGGNGHRDIEHMQQIVTFLRREEHIDMFLVCFDGTSPRYPSYAQSAVKLYAHIFSDFAKHAVLVFNKWTSPEAERMHQLAADYQHIFERDFNVSQVPCFFIDSSFNRCMMRENDDGTQSVRHLHPSIEERTRSQVERLYDHLVGKESKCDVRQIATRESEMDSLWRQIATAKQVVRDKAADAQRRAQEQRIAKEQLRVQQRARILEEVQKARQQCEKHGCMIL